MTHAFRRRTLLAGAAATGLARPAAAQRGEPVLRVVAPWKYTSNDPADTGYIHTRLGVAETLACGPVETHFGNHRCDRIA